MTIGPSSEERPMRIRLERRAGWRMPRHTIKADRSTRLGNPFQAASSTPEDHAAVVDHFQRCMAHPATLLRHQILKVARGRAGEGYFLDIKTRLPQLRGWNLACWCRLCPIHQSGKPFAVSCPDCLPCHVDVLGVLANGLICEEVAS